MARFNWFMKERQKIISWGAGGYNCHMEWLVGLARSPFRKTGLIGLALWIMCFTALLACMKHARMASTGVVYAALAPAVERNPHAGIALQQSIVSPTATITPTLTATSTITPTHTVTSTASLSPTATASPTWTPVLVFSPTPSASPTSLAIVPATSTPDLLGTLLALPTAMLTSTISVPGIVLTQTATLIPFPQITIKVPQVTRTDALNYLEAPPGVNGLPKGSASIRLKLGRLWPFALILIIWLGLAVWFLIVRLLDRH
jgi:hypothetical protein